MLKNQKKFVKGFTLLEVLVVVAIVGVLVTAITINFSDSNKQARDTQRQSDLRELQNAIELYKSKYGQYPEGCNGPDNWSGQAGSPYECSSDNEYIEGISEFLPKLPTDPRLGGNEGYVYVVNANRTVYKIMAMNTVESESLDTNEAYLHEFKSCDRRGRRNPDGSISILTESYCNSTAHDIGYGQNKPVNHCRINNTRFQKSYGLWGGFAPCTGNCSVTSGNSANTVEALTEVIICK